MTTGPTTHPIAGRWVLDAPIGAGGMATVWRGHDTLTERPVAVKLLHPGGDDAMVARFEREAQTLALLDDPGIVRVLDYGDDGTRPYLVMELVEGEGLDAVVARGSLEVDRALAVASGVARALAAAHAVGVVHRDVKTGNIVLAPLPGGGDRPVLVDFGIARSAGASALTQPGVTWASVHGVAPEVLEGNPADERSDVYSTGCVLFEMLTGRPPFTADTALAVAYHHVHDRVPAPSDMGAPVPAAVDAVVARATARDPGARYPSAAAMHAAIEAARSNPAGAQAVADVATIAIATGHSTGETVPIVSGATSIAPTMPLAATAALAVGAAPGGDRVATQERRGTLALVAGATLVSVVVVGALAVSAVTPEPVASAPASVTTQPRPIPVTVTMPALAGLDVGAATKLLEQAGLRANMVAVASAEARPGAVLSTNPSSGVPVAAGSTVLVNVSSGPSRPPGKRRGKHEGGD